MYIIIVTEWSNGLDTMNLTFTFNNKPLAIARMKEIVDSKRKYYQDCGGEIQDDTECHFVADENNMKGNGFEVILVDESVIMDKIISCVNNSVNRYDLEEIDNNCVSHIQSVPVLNLRENLPYTGWHYADPNEYYYQPLYIVARPDKEEDDIIYDVYMNRVHMDDMHNPDVKTDDVKVVYVESLETIGYDILCNIYKHLE